MTSIIDFDSITFKSLTKAQWKKRYRGSIRVTIHWDRFKYESIGLRILEKKEKIYFCWYKNGDYIDGLPRSGTTGSHAAIIRVPVIFYKNKYLLLDGHHRMKDGPMVVLMDVIKPNKGSEIYVNDFNNKFWK